jgi:predicted acetyltransferase
VALTPGTEVVEASLAHRPVVARLFELYQYDFSEFDGEDVDADGLYNYPYLDRYWADPDRHPFLLRVGGKWAGFALVRTGEPHDMAEFFVMRKYRRAGVGAAFARALFARFPGPWQVRELEANVPAQQFWRRTISVAFDDARWDHGPMQVFTVRSPGDPGPG